MRHREMEVLAAIAALAGAVAAACHEADPARVPGEPVMAPVARTEAPPAPPPARPQVQVETQAAADDADVDAEGDSEEEEAVNAYAATLDASSPPPRDPCGGRCTGSTICWDYEHRPAPPPTPATDSGWPSEFAFMEEDASAFRHEMHCLPESASCPRGVSVMSSRMMSTNGVVARWNTCTFYDGH